MISTLAVAGLVALAASAVIDPLALPAVAAWRQRSFRAIALHMTATSWLLVLFYAVSGRIAFSVVCTVGIIGLLMLVSNAKFKALREPVVFSDLALFAQSLWHPRLYFPYLSWLHRFLVVAGIALFALALWLESELRFFSLGVLAAVWAGLLVIGMTLAKGLRVSLNPVSDQAKHGFFSVFVAYLLNGLSLRELRLMQSLLMASPYAPVGIKTSRKSAPETQGMPDVIVIQSESFFDIRKTGLVTNSEIFRNFDALRKAGFGAGALEVPAWGANTMRTEYAFLSGLPNASLRYGSFYPYAFVRRSTPGMAHAFRKQGYRCTAVHPYSSDFFMRRKVFPHLGFDELVDINQFAGAARDGPYISDQAVADWIIKKLDGGGDAPQFVFAITMENHGPFHLETATRNEAKSLYSLPGEQVIDDLTIYLRHLANSDKMLGRIQEYLASRDRKAVLCFYGDHVPALTPVYDALKTNPQQSDYLIWANQDIRGEHGISTREEAQTPEQLGVNLSKLCATL